MVEEAARIVSERNDLGVRLSGPEVAKRLARATVASSKAGEGDIEVTGRGGKAILRYSRNARGALTLKIPRSEEHTSELQSLMRISYAVFCLKKKNTI